MAVATTFRGYMREFKAKGVFQIWDLENMKDLRLSVCKVSEAYLRGPNSAGPALGELRCPCVTQAAS